MARAAIVLLFCGLIARCGAKTGLRIPEYHMDAAVSPDTGIDGGPDAPICMPGHFPLVPETAELMLVIDRSASMLLTINGDTDQPEDQWRWTILRTSLSDALTSLDARVLVGAKFFPDPITSPAPTTEEACTSVGPIDVAVGPGTAPTIISLFRSTMPNGGTPTAVALRSAAMGVSPTGARRFLLLATDGAPNCNPDTGVPQDSCVCTSPVAACQAFRPGPYSCLDDVATLAVMSDIFSRGIPTYVVGIEDLSRPDFSDVLDRMAEAGGRPRMVAGEREFYSVRSAGQLHQALMDITSTISACGFVTPSLPATDDRFSIQVDGTLVPEDATNGWTWVDRTHGELELHGSACTSARGGMLIEAIIDSCPN